MEKTSVLAITKNGINIGENLKKIFPNWSVFAPSKLTNDSREIIWYSEPTTDKIVELFKNNNALICIFSLGAVIRLISPYLKDKKTDPAVIVIDDKTNFVISVLSGHIGGANELTEEIAKKLGALPVITTAADVNKTIAVDLVGREYDWKIDDDSTVTKISAHMVNEEPIGILQEAGEKNWYKKLPKNVIIYQNVEELKKSNSKAHLIISDKIIEKEISNESVIYRPPSLVIGIGLHWDTTKETIREGIEFCLDKFKLSSKSIAKLVSIKKPEDVKGLIDLGEEMGIPVEYVNREDLAEISAPNPSETVKAPNLTIAIARIMN
jgi:cobalt-precorrin 5A hydrolase